MNPNFSPLVERLFIIQLYCGLLIVGAWLSTHLIITSFVRVVDSCLAMFSAHSRRKVAAAAG
jgi:hypothetical protein